MINGVKEMKGFTFEDQRGKIQELNGFPVASITHTLSYPKTLRGLHVQLWDKVIYIASGKVYAIFLDTRKDSPTYGETEEHTLAAGKAYFIPKGVANSYCVLGDELVNYLYFHSEQYDESKTFGINYKQFNYPINNPIVSEKDKNYPYEY
jgi:dTDP-4-dehydrorhamnose 3,5-epimerase-like enzyme